MASVENEKINLSFSWKYGGEAPFKGLGLGSVVEGNVAYFLSKDDLQVHSFDSSTRRWNLILPQCPNRMGSLTLVEGLLTVVGGWPPFQSKATNKLFSLKKGEGSNEWIEIFPPMPTSRFNTTTLSITHNDKKYLIVAGGLETLERNSMLDTIEVLDIGTQVWSTATSLPRPFSSGSATICGKLLYILGGEDKVGACQSAFSCKLEELLQSEKGLRVQPESLWRTTETRKYKSTCVAVCGQLLAIGGADDEKETREIYKFNPRASVESRIWKAISQMTSARSSCNVAVIKNELLVFGGKGNTTVEIAEF